MKYVELTSLTPHLEYETKLLMIRVRKDNELTLNELVLETVQLLRTRCLVPSKL